MLYGRTDVIDTVHSEYGQTHKKRLFVDMDGVLAVFKPVSELETLYEQGYFLNLEPQMNVVEAVRIIAAECPDIEVYILSSVLPNSQYAESEKNQWLDRYLPEIGVSHRIFPPCGFDKKYYVPDVVTENDYLLDDYTHNLVLWEPPGTGIKLLNDINHTRGTWQGSRLNMTHEPNKLADKIHAVVCRDAIIRDSKKSQTRER